MGPTPTTFGGAVDIVCSRFVEQEWFTLVCGTSLARIGLFLGRKNICRAVVITSGTSHTTGALSPSSQFLLVWVSQPIE